MIRVGDCALYEFLYVFLLTPQPVGLLLDDRPQLRHWVSLEASEVLNEVGAEDLVQMYFLAFCLDCEGIRKVVESAVLTERIPPFESPYGYILFLTQVNSREQPLIRR